MTEVGRDTHQKTDAEIAEAICDALQENPAFAVQYPEKTKINPLPIKKSPYLGKGDWLVSFFVRGLSGNMKPASGQESY